MRIFIDNLDRSVTEEELRAAFEHHGQVTTAVIVHEEGKPRGIVQMPNPDEAEAVIGKLNNAVLGEKPVKVYKAPLEDINILR